MKREFKHLFEAIFKYNEYQRVANPILEKFTTNVKPFAGQKIETLKGLTSKFANAVAMSYDDYKNIPVTALPGTQYANVHRVLITSAYGSLSLEISLCFSNGQEGCTYESRTWYLGKVQNGVLVSVSEDCKVSGEPLDYETELKKIKKFRDLEKLAEAAKDEIRISSDVYRYVHFDNE